MNLTVVMITHQMEVVRDACEQVAVVDSGKIVEQGSVKEIFSCPKSEVTKEFMRGIVSNSKDEIVRWSDEGGQFELHFVGEKTGEPVLSRMAKQFDVEFNIRAGGIQRIKMKTLEPCLLIFRQKTEIEKALKFLREQGIIVEDVSGGKNESDFCFSWPVIFADFGNGFLFNIVFSCAWFSCGCFALYYKSDWNFSASDFESGFKPDCKCLAFFSVYHFDDCAFSAFTPYVGDKHWNRSYDYSA